MSSRERKKLFSARLTALLRKYAAIMVVSVDNIGSNQLQSIRKSLRGSSELLLGKNTMMKRCIQNFISETNNTDLLKLLPLLVGKVGLIFTKGDLENVKDVLAKSKVGAPARAGRIAPEDVIIPPGNTGLDPSHSSFFQVLGIPTRINKGTVEILNEVELLKKGEKIGNSQAVLLSKLGMQPFSFSVTIVSIYQDGCVFGPDVLDITLESLSEAFSVGISDVAAVSLAISHPTMAAAPHMLINGFMNVISVALATSYFLPHAARQIAYLERMDFLHKVHNLPEDVIEQILSRFPAQALLQLRSISHYMRYKIDLPRVGLSHYEGGKEAYLISSRGGNFTQGAVNWRSAITSSRIFTSRIDRIFDSRAPFPHFRGACNGLLLFSNSHSHELYLVSPMRRERLPLPKPSSFSRPPRGMLMVDYTCGVGYWNKVYKVVFQSKWEKRTNSDRPEYAWITEVLTVGGSRWRILKSSISVRGPSTACGKYICWSRGVLGPGVNDLLDAVVCFNMEEEAYVRIQGPREAELVATPYLVDLAGITGVVYQGVFADDHHDVEVFTLKQDDGGLMYSDHPHKIKISRIVGPSFDIDGVRVVGKLGDRVIIYYATGNLILTYNINSEVVVAHGSIPDWAVLDLSLIHVQFHTPRAGIVSLLEFDGFSRFDEIAVRDGVECSWWPF